VHRTQVDRLVLVASGVGMFTLGHPMDVLETLTTAWAVGVAPGLAVLRALTDDADDMTVADVVVAMRSPTCPTMQLVGALLSDVAAYWNVRLHYVFTESGPALPPRWGGARTVVCEGRRLDRALLARLLPRAEPAAQRRRAVVCGSLAFEAAMAADLVALGLGPVTTFATG
jgi:ferredoxin-NADP reductase